MGRVLAQMLEDGEKNAGNSSITTLQFLRLILVVLCSIESIRPLTGYLTSGILGRRFRLWTSLTVVSSLNRISMSTTKSLLLRNTSLRPQLSEAKTFLVCYLVNL